jgi:hypothetical protein
MASMKSGIVDWRPLVKRESYFQPALATIAATGRADRAILASGVFLSK